MRKLLGIAALFIAANCHAQGDPAARYNASRAYRQFMDSPSGFRTYSGIVPGYSVVTPTPAGVEIYARSPDYIREEISHEGHLRYETPPAEQRLYIPYAQPVYRWPPYAAYGRLP
jgi:hypothetical protein